MTQHDYVIANQGAVDFRNDINNALSAIVSLNSGASAPTTTFANMSWYDTTNNILKMRNEADDAWIDLHTLDQTNNTLSDISRLKAGYIENLGVSYTGGTFTVHGANGTALSITNPGYVCIPSGSTPGNLILYKLIANQSFDDAAGTSDIENNLFGMPTSVRVDFDVTFWVTLMTNDAENAPICALTRKNQATISPSASSIGAPDDAVADTIDEFWAFSAIDESLYDTNPCLVLCPIRMRMNSSDDWTVQSLTAGIDGFGVRPKKILEWEEISFTAASNSASIGFDLPEDYQEFLIKFERVLPANNLPTLQCVMYEGGSGGTIVNDFCETGYRCVSGSFSSKYDTYDPACYISDDINGCWNGGTGIIGEMFITHANLVGARAWLRSKVSHHATGYQIPSEVSSTFLGKEHDSHDYVLFSFTSGNISSGGFRLLGRRWNQAL
jgi:hypothetical protein